MEENLQIGLMTRNRGPETLRRVLGLFPVLQRRMRQRAGTLSGGEQQMLATARALCLEPKALLLDEPTQGLSEAEITNFCKLVREIAADATILLIEHNMDVVMELAQRITVMNNGAILAEGTPAEITANAAVQQAYLGA